MSDRTKTRPSTAKIPPFGLRLQPDIKARLEKAATEHGRSLNAEIVHRLALSLDADEIKDESAMPKRDLPAGAKVDHSVQVWAERLSQPKNRHDLESMLAVIRSILGQADMPKDN